MHLYPIKLFYSSFLRVSNYLSQAWKRSKIVCHLHW